MKHDGRDTVLVLRHAACEGLGVFEQVLKNSGQRVEEIRADAGQPIPSELGGVGGLIVLGGPMAVYEKREHPHIREELILIEKALHASLPVLGICLGCQLLCTALGGGVKKGEQKEIGWFEVELTDTARRDPFFANFPRRYTAFHWHGDVCELPAYSTLLASSRQTPMQAFSYGVNALGIQFHPEVDEQTVSAFVEAFAAELIEENIPVQNVLGGAALHLPATELLAREAFGTWWKSALNTGSLTLEPGQFLSE